MKTIGLLGGMAWESTLVYYRIINQEMGKRLGGLNSAKIIVNSLNFEDVKAFQDSQDWEGAGKFLGEEAKKLEKAGADCVLICTNTMHKVADATQTHINIPLIHIAKAVADEIKKDKITHVGLLGTKPTMQDCFYKDCLDKELGPDYKLEISIPSDEDCQFVHDVIFKELMLGNIKDSSRKRFISIIEELKAKGAQAVILGCTEIPLLITPDVSPLPVIDTMQIHSIAAVDFALAS